MSSGARTFVRPSRAGKAPAAPAPAAAKVGAPAEEMTYSTPHVGAIAEDLAPHYNGNKAHAKIGAECIHEILTKHVGCTAEGGPPTVDVAFKDACVINVFSNNGGNSKLEFLTHDSVSGEFRIEKEKMYALLDHLGYKEAPETLFVKKAQVTFYTDQVVRIPFPDNADVGESKIVTTLVDENTYEDFAAYDMMITSEPRRVVVDLCYESRTEATVADTFALAVNYPLYFKGLSDIISIAPGVPPRVGEGHHEIHRVLIENAEKMDPSCMHIQTAKAMLKQREILGEHAPKTAIYAGPAAAAMMHTLNEHYEILRRKTEEIVTITTAPSLHRNDEKNLVLFQSMRHIACPSMISLVIGKVVSAGAEATA